VLPEVKPSSFIYGETDPEMFFGTHSIPIAGIAGDQQAALFGQACYGQGRAKNTYGTGFFILMNTGNVAIRSKEKLLTTIAWGIGDAPVEYALEGAIFITGAVSSGCVTALGSSRRQPRLNRAGSIGRIERWRYFVPALVGLGAPIGTHTHAAFSPDSPARPTRTSLEPFSKASPTRRGTWSR
jgi:glycerol kinase